MSDVKPSTNSRSGVCFHTNHFTHHRTHHASFTKPYQHIVAMPKERFGRKTVYLDEIIQTCMVKRITAKPLPWDSLQLVGLAAYLQKQQKSFKPSR